MDKLQDGRAMVLPLQSIDLAITPGQPITNGATRGNLHSSVSLSFLIYKIKISIPHLAVIGKTKSDMCEVFILNLCCLFLVLQVYIFD